MSEEQKIGQKKLDFVKKNGMIVGTVEAITEVLSYDEDKFKKYYNF